jgi:adenylosuccinate lyase
MTLMNISPIDGRYARYMRELQPVLSEYGLIRYRIEVMVLYVIRLVSHDDVPAPRLDNGQLNRLHAIVLNFSTDDAADIKMIETRGWQGIPATNHDVKSCELWLRRAFETHGFGNLVEWIHFGCTSEDVNNIAYGMMLRDAVDVIMTRVYTLTNRISEMANRYATTSMLSRTHGQAATPTTFGKEMAVFASRIHRQSKQIRNFRLTLKLNGASGNYAAMRTALPQVDWPELARTFIERGDFIRSGNWVSFEQNFLTTQIEPHDTYVELFDIIKRINTILVDFAQDMWRYISDGWVVQKPVAGEVGSSAMPHKVNPIQFENAEGNLLIANSLIEMMGRKLPISRLQRDLSDSTVERNFGVVFGHCLVAYENLLAGLGKVSANEKAISDALMAHPEILTEAIQTILRSIGYPNAYDALKTLSRGHKIGLNDIHDFIDSLDSKYVDDATKRRLKSLKRETYIGYAAELAASMTP